jgi:hypothetical protein
VREERTDKRKLRVEKEIEKEMEKDLFRLRGDGRAGR